MFRDWTKAMMFQPGTVPVPFPVLSLLVSMITTEVMHLKTMMTKRRDHNIMAAGIRLLCLAGQQVGPVQSKILCTRLQEHLCYDRSVTRSQYIVVIC